MSTNLKYLLHFIQQRLSELELKVGRGRSHIYSHSSMLVFFMVMLLKKKYSFQAMEKYAKIHYYVFGFPQAPSRKTIRRRFLALPPLLQRLMPQIAIHCQQMNHSVFHFR